MLAPNDRRRRCHASATNRLPRRALALATIVGLVIAAVPALSAKGPGASSRARAAARNVLPAHAEGAREMFGASLTVTADGNDSARVAAVIDSALDEAERVERATSLERTDSEIGRMNDLAFSDAFHCSPDLYAAVDSALELAAETHGAFDPTLEAFTRAWDMRGAGRVPTPAEIATARENSGWIWLGRIVTGQRVRYLREHLAVSLDGLNRGLALERVRSVLLSRGIRVARASFGDEMTGWGASRELGIPHPTDRTRVAVRMMIRDGSAATTCQAARGIVVEGVRYGRILDPRSGEPVRSKASVTVVCRSPTRAAALSNALLVMGRDEAAAYANGHPGVGVLWLEPSEEGCTGWRWNLPASEGAPGVQIKWMN